MIKKISLTVFLLLFGCSLAFGATTPKAKPKRLGDRRDVQVFIWDMHLKHGFNAWDLTKLFKTIESEPKILAAMSKPFEEVTWTQYRQRFVTDERAKAGADFWKKNADSLKKAEAVYGVPPEIIVAIIGLETYYGRNMGNFPVLQALATLAFDYPPRAKFFRSELEEFLVLTKEEKLNPQTVMGSYAGAIGKPQFMPSSYRRYAVDFSGSGHRDLINNTADVIGSVGNYFKAHGWQANQAIALPAAALGSEYQGLINKDPKPKLTLAEFAQFNIRPKDKKVLKTDAKQPAAFIVLNYKEADAEQWLTLNNFYVITRYNHSINYAMAVYQLSQRIKELHKAQS